jgi:hypothetical protein
VTGQKPTCGATLVRQWTTEAGPTLHPTKTKVVDAEHEGFDFLGYHFKGKRFLVEEPQAGIHRAKTLRKHGHDLPTIIGRVNATLRGWFSIINRPSTLRVHDFGQMDPRPVTQYPAQTAETAGRARGRDHQRWPNAFLPSMGCSTWQRPMTRFVNPHRVIPPTEPYAGKPPVRFEGGAAETNRLSLPLSRRPAALAAAKAALATVIRRAAKPAFPPRPERARARRVNVVQHRRRIAVSPDCFIEPGLSLGTWNHCGWAESKMKAVPSYRSQVDGPSRK